MRMANWFEQNRNAVGKVLDFASVTITADAPTFRRTTGMHASRDKVGGMENGCFPVAAA